MNGNGSSGRPFARRGFWHTALQFSDTVTQSRMYTWWPHRLQVGYTRTMLAALLVQPRPCTIGILGLGGGSQAKFCHRHFPQARLEACEASAEVIALRGVFRIPADSERFRVIHDDAARFIRQRRDAYDLLLLDAYDAGGIPSVLSTTAFYDACRDALKQDGILAANLYATDVRRHIARLRRSFDGRVQVLKEPHHDNRVVFAWREQAHAHPLRDVLAAMDWQARHQLRAGIRRLAARLETV